MRKFIASAIAVAFITIPIGAATAAEPGQPCNLAYNADATIVSPGATDCIVKYADLDAALNAVSQARTDGLFVWYVDGVIQFDGSGYVVRASSYVPDQFKPLEVIVAPA